MAHGVQQFIGLGLIVVDTGSVAPAVRGEIQRHHEVLFAIGRCGFLVRRAIGFARPREIPVRRMHRVADVHVGLSPIPKRVELRFLVELHGDHHSVRHAFGPHVVIVPVGQVRQRTLEVLSGREEHSLSFWIAVEELLESGSNFRGDFLRRMSGLRKEIAVSSCRVGAGAIVQRFWEGQTGSVGG